MLRRIYQSRLGACLVTGALVAAACGGAAIADPQQITENEVHSLRNNLPPAFVPDVSIDYNNFNAAQRLYANPATILWCTFSFSNPSSPLVTVPIAGKLTSSSVSYLPQDYVDTTNNDSSGGALRQAFSNDGMYHGSPPPYEYGFTPGGLYNQFGSLPYCSTALTEFQRKQTSVSVKIDYTAQKATNQAEAALQSGLAKNTKNHTYTITPQAKAQAQRALQAVAGNG